MPISNKILGSVNNSLPSSLFSLSDSFKLFSVSLISLAEELDSTSSIAEGFSVGEELALEECEPLPEELET